MLGQRERIYDVYLATADGPQVRRVIATSEGLGVRAAEAMVFGSRALHYTVHVDVIGTCNKCGTLVEASESFRELVSGLLCRECK